MSYTATGIRAGNLHLGWQSAEVVQLRGGETVTRFRMRITEEHVRAYRQHHYLFAGVGGLQQRDVGSTLVVDALADGRWIDHLVDRGSGA
jgi:hypothetical protein